MPDKGIRTNPAHGVTPLADLVFLIFLLQNAAKISLSVDSNGRTPYVAHLQEVIPADAVTKDPVCNQDAIDWNPGDDTVFNRVAERYLPLPGVFIPQFCQVITEVHRAHLDFLNQFGVHPLCT